MATLTRDEIIARAEEAWNIAGYYYGGDFWSNPKHVKYVGFGADGKGLGTGYDGEPYPVAVVPSSESPYIACDCAAFTGWCWGVEPANVSSWSFTTGGAFGSRYHKGFEGLTKGDVLWKTRHVALFCGDYVLELATKDWGKTTNGHGGNRSGLERVKQFQGYCSFDGTFSTDYNPDIETPDDFKPNGSAYEGGNPENVIHGITMDCSPTGFYGVLLEMDTQYTKRYSLMKHYRRT